MQPVVGAGAVRVVEGTPAGMGIPGGYQLPPAQTQPAPGCTVVHLVEPDR